MSNRSLKLSTISSFSGDEGQTKLLIRSEYRLVECNKVLFEKYVSQYGVDERREQNVSEDTLMKRPGVRAMACIPPLHPFDRNLLTEALYLLSTSSCSMVDVSAAMEPADHPDGEKCPPPSLP